MESPIKQVLEELNTFRGWRIPTEYEQKLIGSYITCDIKIEIRVKRFGVGVGLFFALCMIAALPVATTEDMVMFVFGFISLMLSVWGILGIRKSKNTIQLVKRGAYEVLDCKSAGRYNKDNVFIQTEDVKKSRNPYRITDYTRSLIYKNPELPLLLMRCTVYVGLKEETEIELLSQDFLEFYIRKHGDITG